jgi:hypothetical protein
VTTLSLPNWPCARLLEEAAIGWNLHHPKAKLDSRICPWNRLRAAVFAFIRHALTDYGSQLRTCPDRRTQLRREILEASLMHYPYLRSDPRDQIREQALGEDDDGLTLLNEVGRTVTALVNLKHRLIDRLRQPTTSQSQKARIRIQLIELEHQLQHGRGLLDINPNPLQKVTLVWSLERACVDQFDGRTLHPNQIRSLNFVCPLCDARPSISKRPVGIGQGRCWLLASCRCVGVAVKPPPAGYELGIDLEQWLEFLRWV